MVRNRSQLGDQKKGRKAFFDPRESQRDSPPEDDAERFLTLVALTLKKLEELEVSDKV